MKQNNNAELNALWEDNEEFKNQLAAIKAHREQTITWISQRILIDLDSACDIFVCQNYPSYETGWFCPAAIKNPHIWCKQPKGEISMQFVFGEKKNKVEVMCSFVMLVIAAAYNALLWQPLTHQMGVVSSLHHQHVKFPRPKGMVTLWGDQHTSHKCQIKGMSIGGVFLDISCITERIPTPSLNSLDPNTSGT